MISPLRLQRRTGMKAQAGSHGKQLRSASKKKHDKL